jgi:recombination protein RecA
MEHALDFDYARRIGVDIDNLLVVQPSSGTAAIDILLNMAMVCDIIVLDSIGAMASSDSLAKPFSFDKDLDDIKQPRDVGDLARLMSQFQARMMKVVGNTSCTYVFINQLRTKINQHNPAYSSFDTMGGKAVKYMMQLRLRLNTKEEIRQPDGTYIGRRITVSVVRAKHMGVHAATEITIGNCGVDFVNEVVDLSVEFDFIKQGGAWFSYVLEDGTTFKCQGRAALIEYFSNNKPELLRFEKMIRAEIQRCHKEAREYAEKLEQIIDPVAEVSLDEEEERA